MFLSKLEGTWVTNHYIFTGIDETTTWDTTYRNYKLVINGNQTYNETWTMLSFRPDSFIIADSIWDTTALINIVYDTIRRIDTTTTNHMGTGRWDLLNSEEDLQLRDDSDALNPIQWRILKLDKSSLNMQTGNKELDLSKK